MSFILPPLFKMLFKQCVVCKKQRLYKLIDELGVCSLCTKGKRASV